jgi:hypothetical protein
MIHYFINQIAAVIPHLNEWLEKFVNLVNPLSSSIHWVGQTNSFSWQAGYIMFAMEKSGVQRVIQPTSTTIKSMLSIMMMKTHTLLKI